MTDERDIPQYAHLLRLDGKGFVVLGAGQGIGEQSAHALAQSGAKVLCVDFDAGRAEQVARATGGVAAVADVLSRTSMEAVFRQAREQLGVPLGGIVDVVGMPVGKSLADMDDDAWQRQFDLVLRHAWLAIQYGVPAMERGGSIVVVGSMAGSIARGGTLLAYGAAKAALHHLARSAAQEFAPRGIRVNVVAPGLTRTPRLVEANGQAFWDAQAAQIPLGRPAAPADIAAAILYLSTPLAAHVTGNVVMVDGGASLGPVQPIAKSQRD
ncbi:SDR family NAD(P)-dependent oxidoreductase [Variovorax sp. KK3]|uniref:SDR family NAD(P)-dependent oxidoreductase n=1 Tax=Variovorax sp. KK3 TaxID=1855728 RepID=UPI00097C55F7|nr:SDR family oxidoreductase [Variovorax sp. KK3]